MAPSWPWSLLEALAFRGTAADPAQPDLQREADETCKFVWKTQGIRFACPPAHGRSGRVHRRHLQLLRLVVFGMRLHFTVPRVRGHCGGRKRARSQPETGRGRAAVTR